YAVSLCVSFLDVCLLLCRFLFFFFFMLPPPPSSTLFPYTTLFRSVCCAHEYTLSNLRFAHEVDPGNTALADYTAWCMVERAAGRDRKSTRLNSSHVEISYAVFCLKKKKNKKKNEKTKTITPTRLPI